MNDEQLQIIRHTIENTIQDKVNGKIDKVNTLIDAMAARLEAHMEEIRPLLEFMETITALQKFFKWIGLPFIAILVPIIFWLKSL